MIPPILLSTVRRCASSIKLVCLIKEVNMVWQQELLTSDMIIELLVYFLDLLTHI